MAKSKKRVYFGKQSIAVEGSALVERVFYDPRTNTLDAVFHNKKPYKNFRYRYHGVTPLVFSEFILASSMGKFFNTKIRNRYKSEKVRIR